LRTFGLNPFDPYKIVDGKIARDHPRLGFQPEDNVMRITGVLIRSVAAAGLWVAGMSGATAQVADPNLYLACLNTCPQTAALATGYSYQVAMQRCTAECTERYDSDGQGSGGSPSIGGVPIRNCHFASDCKLY